MINIDSISIKNLPICPGVYQFISKDNKILYVGKAKNIRKRVLSYLQKQKDSKTSALIENASYVSIITTSNEVEALLLENTLIKKLQPKYNIVFKDDKSYPFLFISKHEFPRLTIERGKKELNGNYYGPYTNSTVAKEVLQLLQKTFGLRHCIDSFFKNRNKPCIQYQIKRCTAPCAKYISQEDYQQNVIFLKQLLSNKNKQLIKELNKKMNYSSKNLDYENAARYKIQIDNLKKIQNKQCVVVGTNGDYDVIAIANESCEICIFVLFIRKGSVVGSESYFKKQTLENSWLNNSQIVSSFITQYYLEGQSNRFIPKKILLSDKIQIENKILIEKAIKSKILASCINQDIATDKIIKKSKICKNKDEQQWIKMADRNAKNSLQIHISQKNIYCSSFNELKEKLNLHKTPERIECFDVSHSCGEFAVASCVVFDIKGPIKKDYRRFNLHEITNCDDYSAIEASIFKRYTSREIHEKENLPDILIIDGGKGHLRRVERTIKYLEQSKNIKNPTIEKIFLPAILAIAKGKSRKPGSETIYFKNKTELKFSQDTFLLIQQIRNEAHRFAIYGHRKQLSKNRVKSALESIKGIGKKKRTLLLEHFGGIQGIKSASIQDLSNVPGINTMLAKRIYRDMHSLL